MSSVGVKSSVRPPLGVRSLLTSPHYYGTLMWLTLALEAALGIAIIKFIPCHTNHNTEIDWRAYMQEVEGVLGGEWDYQYLRGDTGPLVYPAGFVYIFIALRWLTDEGTNILRAQYIFLGIYLTFIIFMLRLFNDGICMELMYIAVLCILANRWNLSALFLTLALSIKMNILLFLPAYGILCIQRLGVWRAIGKLVIIMVVQVLLAMPFLLHAPQSYMKGAFDFGRQFMYIWTVNLKVLPEEIFLSKNLAQGLLVGHVIFLVFFLNKLSVALTHSHSFVSTISVLMYAFLACVPTSTSSGLIPFFFQSLRSAFTSAKQHVTTAAQSPLYVVSILFITNFAGIVFARSLHYQFYVWYYHTLPLLLYLTPYPHIVRWSLLLLIELVWNIYPSRAWSSALLIVCHSIILIGLMISRRLPDPPVQQQAVVNKKVQ